jgi:VWFA-related protein
MAAAISRAGVLAALLLCGAVTLAQQPPQVPPSIRVRIAMVPVDVRIVDRQGNPVTDLKPEDFTLLEDGVPQEIRHFSAQALAADPTARDTAPLPRRAPRADVSIANKRVFLVLLGRGRHQAVVGGVDALSAFVRERLLPQDQIALMAWNRATDFMTDHALLARTVARYGAEAEGIESDLRSWFTGLRAVYGSRAIPPQIQRRIDAVFAEAAALRPRQVSPGQMTDTPRGGEDARRPADDQISRMPTVPPALDPEMLVGASAEKKAALTAAFAVSTFDAFVSQATETFQDLGALYAGIEYLRHFDGEKHLVLFTERGLRLRSREDHFALARAASDARIAVDTIHTGGIAGPPPPRYVGTTNNPSNLVMQPIQSGGALFAESMAAEDLRAISQLTGGQATAFRKGSDAFDRIDRSTRFQYLLGYYPANTDWDGKFRKLTVTAKRPGVTVLYRHGFYATEQLVPIDRRQFLTSSRVYEAGKYQGAIDDIKLTLKQPRVTDGDVVLEMHVDLSRVAFNQTNDRHTAKLNLAVFFGDAKQVVVGETWRTLDLNANEANRARLVREGTPVAATIPLPAGARDVKVVIYDYGSDLLGTATAKVR